MCIGLHIKCLYSCPTLSKPEFSRHVFTKYSDIRFHEIRPLRAESRVVSCGQTEGRTDITKLIAAFRNFAKAPKNDLNISITWSITLGGGGNRPWLLAIYEAVNVERGERWL
jgi:hypothetical protein